MEEELPTTRAGDQVRRPMNAFLIFCKRHRSMVREKHPQMDNRNITRILGEWWANLCQEEKAKYVDLAKQYKDAFMKANPDFKWHTERSAPASKPNTRPTNVRKGSWDKDGTKKFMDMGNMGGLSMLLMASQHTQIPGTYAEIKDVLEDDSTQPNNAALLELAQMCSNELKSEEEDEIDATDIKEEIKPEPPDIAPGAAPVAKENCAILRKTLESVKDSPITDEALATCGRQVVDHVIDKLYSKEKTQAQQRVKRELDEVKSTKPVVKPVKIGSVALDCVDTIIRKAVEGSAGKTSKCVKKVEVVTMSLPKDANATLVTCMSGLSTLGRNVSMESRESVAKPELKVKRVTACEKPDSLTVMADLPKDTPDGKVQEDDVFSASLSRQLSQESLGNQEEDTEAILDDSDGLRKSKRTNRGRRYKELISEGYIQPPKGEKAVVKKALPASASAMSVSDEEPIEISLPDTMPNFSFMSAKKRHVSEPAALGLSPKKYKTGDFDLEAHIAELPACNMENLAKKKAKASKKVRCLSESMRKAPHEYRSEDDMSPTKDRAPPVGSRKRKARKASITHLVPQSPTSKIKVPAHWLKTAEDTKSAILSLNQEGSIRRTQCGSIDLDPEGSGDAINLDSFGIEEDAEGETCFGQDGLEVTTGGTCDTEEEGSEGKGGNSETGASDCSLPQNFVTAPSIEKACSKEEQSQSSGSLAVSSVAADRESVAEFGSLMPRGNLELSSVGKRKDLFTFVKTSNRDAVTPLKISDLIANLTSPKNKVNQTTTAGVIKDSTSLLLSTNLTSSATSLLSASKLTPCVTRIQDLQSTNVSTSPDSVQYLTSSADSPVQKQLCSDLSSHEPRDHKSRESGNLHESKALKYVSQGENIAGDIRPIVVSSKSEVSTLLDAAERSISWKDKKNSHTPELEAGELSCDRDISVSRHAACVPSYKERCGSGSNIQGVLVATCRESGITNGRNTAITVSTSH